MKLAVGKTYRADSDRGVCGMSKRRGKRKPAEVRLMRHPEVAFDIRRNQPCTRLQTWAEPYPTEWVLGPPTVSIRMTAEITDPTAEQAAIVQQLADLFSALRKSSGPIRDPQRVKVPV